MTSDDILNPAVLDRLNRSAAEAVGLPNAAYTSRDFLQREYDRLFAPGWVYAGTAADLRQPGDTLPVTVAGLPILLLRNRAGEIKAFHNVCSHRGALLLREPVRRPTITCPYHAWTYDLDGRLIKTPHIGGDGVHRCAGIEPETLGLRPVRCEHWAGLIFVNLSGDALALAAYLKPLTDRWAAYDFGLLRHGGSVRYELACNWKFAIENYLESYHLPWVHPGLNSYSSISDHYCFFADEVAGGQGTRVYAPSLTNGQALPEQPGLPDELRRRAEYPVLFPNLMLGLQADHFFTINTAPVAPDRTVERFDIYFFGDAAMSPALSDARTETVERWNKVFLEDIDVIERLQLGRASPAVTGGRFSPVQDEAVHAFQRLVANRLSGRESRALAAQ